ncbi:NfeD family protein [Shewanella sp. AS16]|uniref:NfeD family protein n=1 Tax=Shewanella sp. AS16 TaxID=2907625 RepID=UPI001F303170|nr:NfeD family protein [Shewanella sp. AS16]MCE9687298.1 NfeD family protein [Shewanella sp. AS16]
MCHILLVLPFLALPLFWLLPQAVAVPIYGIVLILSIAIYLLAIRAMRLPVVTGPEALVHQLGVIIDRQAGNYRVRLQNELWNAHSDEDMQPGERVEVVSMQGVTLKVKRASMAKSGKM